MIKASKLLPPSAVRALQEAANTPIGNDRLARTKAIERVTQRLRRTYPHYFRSDDEINCDK